MPLGPGRRRANRGATGRTLLLAAPRVSPEWELAALRVLMKPHEWTRGWVAHRSADQPWSAAAATSVESTTAAVAERLTWIPAPRVHFPADGDVWFVIEAEELRLDEAKGLAVVLSKRLPGLWLTLDRIFVRDGAFFRRKRDNTFKIRLVPAPAVHLSRATRSAVRAFLSPKEP